MSGGTYHIHIIGIILSAGLPEYLRIETKHNKSGMFNMVNFAYTKTGKQTRLLFLHIRTFPVYGLWVVIRVGIYVSEIWQPVPCYKLLGAVL